MPNHMPDTRVDEIDDELARPDLLDFRRLELTVERRRLLEPDRSDLAEPARPITYTDRRRLAASWPLFKTGAFGPPMDAFSTDELAVIADELRAAELADLLATA